jgi:hypothetical protein
VQIGARASVVFRSLGTRLAKPLRRAILKNSKKCNYVLSGTCTPLLPLAMHCQQRNRHSITVILLIQQTERAHSATRSPWPYLLHELAFGDPCTASS